MVSVVTAGPWTPPLSGFVRRWLLALDRGGDPLGVVGDEGVDHDLRIDAVGLGDLGDGRPAAQLLDAAVSTSMPMASAMTSRPTNGSRRSRRGPPSVRREIRASGIRTEQDVGTDLDVRECRPDARRARRRGHRPLPRSALRSRRAAGAARGVWCRSSLVGAVGVARSPSASVSTTSLDVGGAAPVVAGPRSRAAVAPPPSTAAAMPPAIVREWGCMSGPFLVRPVSPAPLWCGPRTMRGRRDVSPTGEPELRVRSQNRRPCQLAATAGRRKRSTAPPPSADFRRRPIRRCA